MEKHFIVDAADYSAARLQVESIFDCTKRIPDQVFRTPVSDPLIIEYEAGVARRFWPHIAELAKLHGDSHICYTAIDYHDDSWVLDEGVYPAFVMRSDEPVEEFFNAITASVKPDDTVALFRDLSMVVAVVGDSGMWGCWGERDFSGMVIGAANSAVVRAWRESLQVPRWSAYGYLDKLSDQFPRGVIPSDFLVEFLENYRPFPRSSDGTARLG